MTYLFIASVSCLDSVGRGHFAFGNSAGQQWYCGHSWSRRAFAYLSGCGFAAAERWGLAERFWHRVIAIQAEHWVWSTLVGVRLAERNGTSRKDVAYTADDLWPKVDWPPKVKVRRSIRDGIDMPEDPR